MSESDAIPSKPLYPIQNPILDLSFHSVNPSSPVSESLPARRLIIVGDVHGAKRTLQALLCKVAFDPSSGDKLFFVGDLVNKGPDSAGVVDLAIEYGARSVRGNHDDAVLRAFEALKNNTSENKASGNEPPLRKSSNNAKGGSCDTAKTLLPRHMDYLSSNPLMIRLSWISRNQNKKFIIVHAGIVPGLALEAQSPYAVMHMRSLQGTVPREEAGERGWVGDWDAWEGDEKETVVFGHDAKRRLQRGRWAFGLDTGCVYGGCLTALVVGHGEEELVCVDCVEGDERVDGDAV